MTTARSPLSFSPHALLLAGLLMLLSPRTARAESSLTFKAQSWQEDNQRIRVDSQYGLIETDLSTSTRFKLMGVIDSISGATPTGELARTPGAATPLATMYDRRKAWDAALSHQFERVNVTAGVSNSRESDYVSNGLSLNTVTDFNNKNTGLLLGYGRNDDIINGSKIGWTIKRPKTVDDFLVGLTQLVDKNTSVTANISWGAAEGFLSDPYKIVSTRKLNLDPGFYYTVPENRPTEKNKVSVFLGANHNVESWRGAIDASYRYYDDSFGIASHTLSLLWIQKISERLMLQPSIRWYRQSAADFYYTNLDAAGIVTRYEPKLGETGTGMAPYYSSDYRLAHMQTIDVGLKLIWQVKPWVAIDVAYNRYTSRGLDGVTRQDAFSQANAFTVGLKLTR